MKRIPTLEEYLERISHPNISECVIFGSFVGDSMILAKNRDRLYSPEITIYREYIEESDLEIVYLRDEDTGWMEGMNSAGIGVVNSALMVGRDEMEKKIVKHTGKKSKDGKRIIYALRYSKLEDVIHSLVIYNKGVKGHTIVSDGEKIYAIECTSKEDAIVTEKDPNKPLVRTNHGHEITTAGYTQGEDYLSSVLRKSQVIDNINDTKGDIDIFDILSKTKLNSKDPNNPVRDTDHMKTTSQMFFDLKNLVFNFKPIDDKMSFKGIVNKTPEGYKNRIDIKIV